MEFFVTSRLVPALTLALVVLFMPVNAQITTPCTPSMISSFTPCVNFITNSSANGTSPTQDCCGALKGLAGSGMSCLCLILTAGVPFQIPINRTLAIGLPRACNMPGVPVQCKSAAGAPVPAPGPAALGPILSPSASPSQSPMASVVPGPTSAEAPDDNTPLLTPPSSTGDSGVPTTSGSRTDLTPSAAISYTFSPSLLLSALSFAVFKFY